MNRQINSAIPKADIHLHAEAGPRLDQIFASRGERTGYDWTAWASGEILKLPPGMARFEAMSKDLIAAEDDTDPGNFQSRVHMALEDTASHGAVYAEVRFGRNTVLREDMMSLFRSAERETQNSHPFFYAEALATINPQVDQSEPLVEACIRAARDGLAGVDLIPVPYDIEAEWSAAYARAERLASAGLGITVHAGEFSTANLASALATPGVTRIGHGAHAAFDPRLVEQVSEAGVALECCLTSNVILGAVESFESHPVKTLADSGIPVTINTDNPVRFRTHIAQEYERAAAAGMTSADLKQATLNAIEFSFTTPERKERLRQVLDESAG